MRPRQGIPQHCDNIKWKTEPSTRWPARDPLVETAQSKNGAKPRQHRQHKKTIDKDPSGPSRLLPLRTRDDVAKSVGTGMAAERSARGGIRTPTAFRPLDPKSSASASSATLAIVAPFYLRRDPRVAVRLTTRPPSSHPSHFGEPRRFPGRRSFSPASLRSESAVG